MTRAAALLLALAALALAFTVARPRASPGPVLRDFESYWAAGASVRAGDDPYSRQIWRAEKTVPGVDPSRDETLPFVGPPFGLLAWSQLARAGYAQAAGWWMAVLTLAFVLCTLGSARLAGPLDAAAVLGALFLGAAFGPLTSGIALGQTAIVACAASIGALLRLRAGNVLGAGVAATIAFVQPNVGIALFARLGERRAAIALALATAIALGGSLLAAAGPAGALRYVGMLREHAGAERFMAIQTTPAAALQAFGTGEPVANAFGLSLAVGVLLVLTGQFASRRYDGIARYALAAAALPLAWPFAHEHDFALVLAPLILVLRQAPAAQRWLALAATLFVAVDWLGLAQRPEGTLQEVLLAAAAVSAAFTLSAREHPRAAAVAFGVGAAAVLTLLVGSVALTHPMPIWPDALPANFSVPHTVSIGETWKREQTAAGLSEAVPLWGFLRSLSLLGCALAWYAASRALIRPRAAPV